jgi:hypothetical protein
LAIPYGQLEQILTSEFNRENWNEARKNLVWKNFYFGRRLKKSIKWQANAHYSSPAHVIKPNIFAELEKLVDFSAATREYFQHQGEKKPPRMPLGFFQLKGVSDKKNLQHFSK